MNDLLSQMRQCKTLDDCIELAMTDAYGEYEEAAAWQACIETLLGDVERVKVLGEEVSLKGFDLVNNLSVVALCHKGKKTAKVALESVQFPKLTPTQALWIKAWKKWSRS